MCVQVFLNPPGKKGKPPFNLSLEVMDCAPEDAIRFEKAPTWFAALQERRPFRRTAKEHLVPDLLEQVEPLIENSDAPGVRFGVISPENIAVYIPEDDGSVTVNILFADGVQSFNLPAQDGRGSAFRLFHDPHNMYQENRLHIVKRKKVSPMEAEVAKLREEVAVMRRRYERMAEWIVQQDRVNKALEAEIATLRESQMSNVQRGPVVPLSRDEMMSRFRGDQA
jgi:hypothetical protein